jgi:predicted phosphodiesterase
MALCIAKRGYVMADPDTSNRLILNPEQRTGTVGLPGCSLVIEYRPKGEETTSDESIDHTSDHTRAVKRSIPREQREPKNTYRPPDWEATGEPVRILHLSDLHMERGHDPQTIVSPLVTDLRESLKIDRLHYLVISGDVTESGKPEEFSQALILIMELIQRLGLKRERCIVVPGNHDINWGVEIYAHDSERRLVETELEPGSYYKKDGDLYVRNDDLYPQRFQDFSDCLYWRLIGHSYWLDFKRQCMPISFPDDRILFLAMNSCWQIDEQYPDRSGIHPDALIAGSDQAEDDVQRAERTRQSSDESPRWRPREMPGNYPWLRIAVCHHPVRGKGQIQDDTFLGHLRQRNYQLCLHGHTHEVREDCVGYLHPTKIHVIGAGSFGAPPSARPESTPGLYNVLEIEPGRIKVHTRQRQRMGGEWGPCCIYYTEDDQDPRSCHWINLGPTTLAPPQA